MGAGRSDPARRARAPVAVIAAIALAAWGCGRTEPLSFPVPSPADGGDTPTDGGGPNDGGASLDAGPTPACILSFSPSSIDFGDVPFTQPPSNATRLLTIVNEGDAGCVIGDLSLAAGSDPEFTFIAVPPLLVEPGPDAQLEIPVIFTAAASSTPRQRTATLLFDQTAPSSQVFSVPLSAEVTVGCELTAAPDPLDFGNVPLNTNRTAQLTLTNAGDAPCDISAVSVGVDGGSPLFTLAMPVLSPASVAPNGGSLNLEVSFSGDDSATPHERTSAVNFTVSQPSGEPRLATTEMSVPVEANIDTACLAGSQWIYTVDVDGDFAIFDPETLSFTDLGILSCPDSSSPFSMAVDQSAVAWVEYLSGSLYRVDTTTLECTPTSFQVNSQVTDFGMGFVYNPVTSTDTLYVAGGTMAAFDSSTPSPSTLATIAFPSLALAQVGPISIGSPELSGTGDGQLWAFAPSEESVSDTTILAQLDPATGNVLVSYAYDIDITGGYAMKFWGGWLWIFVGDSVYQASRDDGGISAAVLDTGRTVVGAGVSTCAPLTPP